MDVEQRLAAMGLSLPEPAAALASYVPYVAHDGLLHVSGQVSRRPDGSVLTGQLGEMGVDEGAEAARSCALHLLAQVRAACGGDWERLVRAVKLTGFVASAPGFFDQPRVVNGASDLMVAALGEPGRHARSAVGVAALPLGAAVEVEGLFVLR